MMISRLATRLAVFACLALGASGCAIHPTAPLTGTALPGKPRLVASLPPPDTAGDQRSLTIGPSDLLAIDVFQVDDLDHIALVDATGEITLPLIGRMQVAGETVAMLESDIEARYGARYLQSPVVSVSVKDSPGQRVTVDGEVKTSGLYPASAGSTLLQVIAQAGGVSAGADLGKVFVFRRAGGEQLVANYSLEAIRASSIADPQIYGGDVVVVFPSGTHAFAQTFGELFGIAADAKNLL